MIKIFSGIVFLLLISSVKAQDFQGLIGEPLFSTTIETQFLNSEKIKEASFSAAHYFDRFKNSRIGVSARSFELDNNLKAVPNYYNVQLGLNYKHYLDNERTLGFFGTYGSASDRRFKDTRDSTISLNSAYRYNDRWIWIVNYSNNRTFLNNIPLPGFVYVHEQSRSRTFIIGFPFVLFIRPVWEEKFTIRYLGFIPYNHNLRLSYNGFTFLKPYISIEQAPQVYFDTARTKDNERIFWFERKVAFGVEKSFGPVLKLDLQVGRSFDREYFAAESFGDKHHNIVKVDAGTYASFNLKTSF